MMGTVNSRVGRPEPSALSRKGPVILQGRPRAQGARGGDRAQLVVPAGLPAWRAMAAVPGWTGPRCGASAVPVPDAPLHPPPQSATLRRRP